MRQQFKITYLDGRTVQASSGLAEQVAFEREFDRSIAELASSFRITDICWLAWRGLKRAEPSLANFDTWIETVETVEVVDHEDMAPLETAAPTG